MRLAQLDRAFGYGPKGRGFESSNARCDMRMRMLMDAYTHILVEAAGKPWVMGSLWQEEIRLSEIMYKDRTAGR